MSEINFQIIEELQRKKTW